MARARNGVSKHKYKKRILKRAKGFVGGRSKLYRQTMEAVAHADRYAYRDRRVRKRDFRRLWIVRISAATRQRGMAYSLFIHGLIKAGVTLDRKQMADIAVADEAAFDALVEQAKAALAA